MFWPPRPARRLPPTNATSARPQTADSSPMVSIRMIGGAARRSVAVPGPQLASPEDRLVVLLEPERHLVESLGMPRNQDQPQASVLPPRRRVGGQHGRLFAFHRAAGDEDQVGRGQAQQLAQLTGLGVVSIALQAVILDRARDADPMARDAQIDESPSVFRILRGHDVDPAQRRLQAAVAGFDSRDSSAG